jgi:hypothetical protein
MRATGRRGTAVDEEMLKTLCNVYVVPTADAVGRFQQLQSRQESMMRRTTSSFAQTTRSLRTAASPSISHENRLYESQLSSRRVLASNRQTYTIMMTKLDQIQRSKTREKTAAVRSEKKLLDDCRRKIRRIPKKKSVPSLVTWSSGESTDGPAGTVTITCTIILAPED